MSAQMDTLLNDISGLSPKACLILGSGFVREEWKSLCFERGRSIVQEAIQNPKSFAQNLVPESKGRLMDRQTRVELIKQSLKDPHFKDALPKLLEHRFRPKFYESLERALTQGRELFAHAVEAKVLEDRLLEKVGFEEKREEFFLLNQFWERLLEARSLWDEARLFEMATQRLAEGAVSIPFKKVYHLEHFLLKPRMKFYWDEIAKHVECVSIHSSALLSFQPQKVLHQKRAHSLEDGAQSCLDEILRDQKFEEHALVIEDRPEIRRTIKRIAEERGLLLLDPRDPTLLIQSESMKSALLDLEMVSKNFKSSLVLNWVGSLGIQNAGQVRKKIIESGVTEGLESYRFIPEVYSNLKELKEIYPSRMTLEHLSKSLKHSIRRLGLQSWVAQTLDRLIQDWSEAGALIGLEKIKRPSRYWLEELKERLKSTTPLIGPMKNKKGLKLFRVDQAISIPLLNSRVKIHFFGVSSSFFDFKTDSSLWFSNRDIEVLGSEFSIPSAKDQESHAKQSFLSWLKVSNGAATFWEYLYNEEGSEQESLELVLSGLDGVSRSELELLPVHPKVLPSFTTELKEPKPHVQIKVKQDQFPISFLNSLGNCAFTAYAQHLLKLYDERDPDFDLSGDTFGNLVHAAIEGLVSSQGKRTPEQAFQDAWLKTAKLAWMRSDRLFNALKRKTIHILQSFLESEAEYRKRSRAEVISQEESIILKREGFSFIGRMDRIDQHADGIILMDYKTSGVLPSGTDTLEKLKGLQLPAYALAIKDKMNQEVVGAQYIQLGSKKTNRNLGFLFSAWNKGKASDAVEFPISTAKGNSKSLLVQDPETTWRVLDDKIKSLLNHVKEGNFSAVPADPKDCERCRYAIVCGRKRGISEVVSEEST